MLVVHNPGFYANIHLYIFPFVIVYLKSKVLRLVLFYPVSHQVTAESMSAVNPLIDAPQLSSDLSFVMGIPPSHSDIHAASPFSESAHSGRSLEPLTPYCLL